MRLNFQLGDIRTKRTDQSVRVSATSPVLGFENYFPGKIVPGKGKLGSNSVSMDIAPNDLPGRKLCSRIKLLVLKRSERIGKMGKAIRGNVSVGLRVE